MNQNLTLQVNNDAPPLRKFAYALAWLAFAANVISTIVDTIKDKKPPDRNDYKKN
jgi:hypothetical protein